MAPVFSGGASRTRPAPLAALMTENREHIYHAAMLDPHTVAEPDLQQIWDLVDEPLAAHGEWLPQWARA